MIYALKTTYKSFCLKVSLMALAALSLVACSQDVDSDDAQKNIVSVYFTLSVNEAAASVAAKSRATAPPEGTGTWQSYDPKGKPTTMRTPLTWISSMCISIRSMAPMPERWTI